MKNHSVVLDSSRPHELLPTGLLCPWNSPGKNTGMGYQSLLQGIFPTRGSNPSFLCCRQTLDCLTHLQSPSICPACSWCRSPGQPEELQAQQCPEPGIQPSAWHSQSFMHAADCSQVSCPVETRLRVLWNLWLWDWVGSGPCCRFSDLHRGSAWSPLAH